MSEKKLKELKDPLDEEALYDLFYNILWTKETMYEEADFKLYVPDTVIYRSGTPVSWYFSTTDGVLRKKKSINLTNEVVQETFLRKKPKSKIIGYFISISSKQEPLEEEGEQKTPIVEYFDEKSFKELFTNPQRLHRGILQRFIDPPGPHNNIIQTVWTSNVCILGRRVNVKNLYDQYSNPYERCVTYDGPDYLSIACINISLEIMFLAPVRGIFSTKIKEFLEKVVRHVAGASFDKYSLLKFVSYLKTDEDGKVWYLWSGYVKFATRTAQKLNKSMSTMTFGTPDLTYLESHFEISKEKVLPQLGKPSLEKPQKCVNCENSFSVKDFVEIDYKKIIQDAPNNPNVNTIRENIDEEEQLKLLICPKDSKKYKETADELRVRDKNADIPLLIRKLHPNLKPKEFAKLKSEQYFLNKKVDVCYNCFFEIVTTNSLAGNEELFINDQVVLKGTQGLRYESLKIKKEVLDTHIKNKKVDNLSSAKIRATSVEPALRRTNTASGFSALKLDQLYAKDNREGVHSSMSKRETARDGLHSSISKRESTRAASSLSRVTRNQSNPSISRGATPYRLEQASEIRENEFDFPSNIHNNTMEKPVDKDPNELLKWLKKEDNIFVKAKSKQILTPNNFSMAFSKQIDENKLKLKELTKKSDNIGMVDANRLYSLFQKRSDSREEEKIDSLGVTNNTEKLRPKSGSDTFKRFSDGDTYFRLKNMNFATHNNILVGKPSVEINSKIFRITPDEEQLFNDQIMNLETPEKTLNEQSQNPEANEDPQEMASPAVSNGIGSIPEDVPIASNYGSQKEVDSLQNSMKNEPNFGRKGSQREINNTLKFAHVSAIYKPSTGTSYREPYYDRKKDV